MKKLCVVFCLLLFVFLITACGGSICTTAEPEVTTEVTTEAQPTAFLYPESYVAHEVYAISCVRDVLRDRTADYGIKPTVSYTYPSMAEGLPTAFAGLTFRDTDGEREYVAAIRKACESYMQNQYPRLGFTMDEGNYSVKVTTTHGGKKQEGMTGPQFAAVYQFELALTVDGYPTAAKFTVECQSYGVKRVTVPGLLYYQGAYRFVEADLDNEAIDSVLASFKDVEQAKKSCRLLFSENKLYLSVNINVETSPDPEQHEECISTTYYIPVAEIVE